MAVAIFLVPVNISTLQGFTLVILYADAGSKESQSESEDLSESSDTENQSPDTESEDSTDSETNESDGVTPSEDISNTTTNTSSPESITMTQSDLNPSNRTSNVTQGEPNATLTIQEKLNKGIIPETAISFPYTVKVKFDSIFVADTHEGTFSGDGEYDIVAYVQGIKVGLTDNSYGGGAPYAYTGALPPVGLGDVSVAEEVDFDPGTEVTVKVPGTLPLSIFATGDEIDDCDRKSHPDNIQDKIVAILQKPQSTWLDSIRTIALTENIPNCSLGLLENRNDRLGILNKIYLPPGQSYEPVGYGAGAHTKVYSDTGDFTLRYTITVTPPPSFQSKQGTFNTNNFASTNNFSTTNNFQSQLNNDFAKSLAP